MINKFFFIIKSVILLTLIINISLLTCYANPIPVFCMAGWVKDCSSVTEIGEYDADTYSKLKFYSTRGSEIGEYDADTYSKLKFYSISGSEIGEYDADTNSKLKFYSISSSEIGEYDADTYSKLKFYSISGSLSGSRITNMNTLELR